MMPQTCYNPTYGCYRGSRYIHRYPPFHGTFYRRPYNYRTYFDYPWHAQPHEPTSLFSYNTAEEAAEEAAPEPPPSTSRSTPRPLSYFQPTIGSGVRQPASDSTTQRVRPVSAKLRR
jgi:hypothetical protein